MRKQNKSRISHINCKGGGASGGNSRRAISTPTAKRRTKTSTNQVDKREWNKPPNTRATFFKGKRLYGTINPEGEVYYSLDGDYDKRENPGTVPAQELKDMKRAWQEYIKSPNSKRVLKTSVYDRDGAGKTREKMYQKFGFKITKKGDGKNPTELVFDNRK